VAFTKNIFFAFIQHNREVTKRIATILTWHIYL
jgi:hypothetical protein